MNQYPAYHIHNLKARTFGQSASKAPTVLETLYRNLKNINQRNPRKVTFKNKKRYSYWVKVFGSLYKTPFCVVITKRTRLSALETFRIQSCDHPDFDNGHRCHIRRIPGDLRRMQ